MRLSGPDLLLLRQSGSPGNRAWNSGSVVRNSDHWTTEELIAFNVSITMALFSSIILALSCQVHICTSISPHPQFLTLLFQPPISLLHRATKLIFRARHYFYLWHKLHGTRICRGERIHFMHQRITKAQPSFGMRESTSLPVCLWCWSSRRVF
jgi:hypothetical protein